MDCHGNPNDQLMQGLAHVFHDEAILLPAATRDATDCRTLVQWEGDPGWGAPSVLLHLHCGAHHWLHPSRHRAAPDHRAFRRGHSRIHPGPQAHHCCQEPCGRLHHCRVTARWRTGHRCSASPTHSLLVCASISQYFGLCISTSYTVQPLCFPICALAILCPSSPMMQGCTDPAFGCVCRIAHACCVCHIAHACCVCRIAHACRYRQLGACDGPDPSVCMLLLNIRKGAGCPVGCSCRSCVVASHDRPVCRGQRLGAGCCQSACSYSQECVVGRSSWISMTAQETNRLA
jgi:hypothetical protein